MKAKYSNSTKGIYIVGVSQDIPLDALDIPDELYARYTNAQINRFDVVNGVVVEYQAPAPSTAKLKLNKLSEINTEFEKAMLPIITGIPAIERESWKKQETEARAYLASNGALTPLIDSLAISRGIDKAELVSRIIVKADLFATLSGQLIGKRQRLEDDLNALPETAAAEDIAAITW